MNYALKRKNENLAAFNIQSKEVKQAIFLKQGFRLLPLPLKRIIHQKEEFIDSENENFYFLNNEGCWLLENWLRNREVPISRDQYSSYVQGTQSALLWMLDCNAYSFTDCYWICKEGVELAWKDILHRRNAVDMFHSVKDKNGLYKEQQATLGGQLEKFWYKSDNELKLCKKVNKAYNILNAREVIATMIYSAIGYKACNYEFVFDTDHEVVGVKCNAFVNDNVELVTAYDLLEEYNFTQQDEVWEHIINLACKYGADPKQVRKHLEIQTIVDYLITNRDRHQGNIGFLRDTHTLQIVGVAPVYDSGSSKEMEGLLPEGVTSTTINSLYSTELECLKHVQHNNLIKFDDLPNTSEIIGVLQVCKVPSYTIEKFIELYKKKLSFLESWFNNDVLINKINAFR